MEQNLGAVPKKSTPTSQELYAPTYDAAKGVGSSMPGAGYGRYMGEEVAAAREKGGTAAGVGKFLNLMPGAVLAAGVDAADKVAGVVEPIVRPYAQALKTAVTGDSTPIGQEMQAAQPAASVDPQKPVAAPQTQATPATEAPAAEATVASPAGAKPVSSGESNTKSVTTQPAFGAVSAQPAAPVAGQKSIETNDKLAAEVANFSPENIEGLQLKLGVTNALNKQREAQNKSALDTYNAESQDAERKSIAADRGVGRSLESKKMEKDGKSNEARDNYYRAQTRGLELGQREEEQIAALEDSIKKGGLTPEQLSQRQTMLKALKDKRLNDQISLARAKEQAKAEAQFVALGGQ